MVRAYKGGTKKATHKSTLKYWQKYLSVKETLPTRKVFEVAPVPNAPSASATAVSPRKGANPAKITWDSRTSPEDMEDMWNNANVSKEWTKSGEKRGKVRLSHDTEKRPYLSRTEQRGLGQLGYKGYIVNSVEDLTNPFVSMYFGAAYMAWLSEYEGRERSPQFVVEAYISGPQNVKLQETCPLWLKFEEAQSHYEDTKKEQNSCSIL